MFKFLKFQKSKALEPLIATILLIVVSVVLVIAILSWGKNFTTESTKNTNEVTKLKPSDATYYVYPKTAKDGVIEFNYSPPTELAKEELIIEKYIVANIPEMTEPVEFDESIKLSNTNILDLPCLYEYASTTPDLYIQLITDKNTYIDVKIKDQGMVCTSSGDGSENNPKVICTASDLNSIREEDNLSKNYILGKDIDLGCFSKKISDQNGWKPIIFSAPGVIVKYYFSGSFDGQNHVITNLFINRPEEATVGLFAGIATPGVIIVGKNYPKIIKNLILQDVNIIGKEYVGGLVGSNDGTIQNSYAEGKVSGIYVVGGLVGANLGNIENSYATGDVSGEYVVGGLVGANDYGIIENSYATGNVSGVAGEEEGIIYGLVGGLVGVNLGNIETSYATGDVSGEEMVGGLVGSNNGTIQNSYATGDVSGEEIVGGLVGDTAGNIENSYATGDVSGEETVGGLVGDNLGYIENSYATGEVSGLNYVGGLVGINEFHGTIKNSYTTGRVNGSTKVGGLVGHNHNYGAIQNSYSTGGVSGEETVGGFVGQNSGYISTSYATGLVNGQSVVGGFVGDNENIISLGYWDVNTSGETYGVGSGDLDLSVVIGLTTTQMKNQENFVSWNLTTIWAISPSINNGYPHLRNNPPPN